MQRRGFLTTIGIAATSMSAVGPALGAGSEATSGIDLDGGPYRTNEQLATDLDELNDRSDRISLRVIGQSAGRGDPIHEVTIGEGETNVHLITQIHGDEPVGTEAILGELQRLAGGDSKRVERVLDSLTLTVIPRVNPDGAMYATNTDDDPEEERLSRRYNTKEWSSGDTRHEPAYHYTPDDAPPGYDLNRDFNIRTDFEPAPDGDDEREWWTNEPDGEEVDWSLAMPYDGHTLSGSGSLQAPETHAVIESFLGADPDIAITHHHQGLATVPDSGTPPEPSVMSVMAPFGPAYGEQAPGYDADAPVESYVNPFLSKETSARSLRLGGLVADALAETAGPWEGFDSVTRYGYTTLWGSYLDTLCPQTGAAGMLYEISGQADAVGSRGFDRKLEATRVGFESTFEALAADPDLGERTAEAYFELPIKGEDVDDVAGIGLDPQATTTR